MEKIPIAPHDRFNEDWSESVTLKNGVQALIRRGRIADAELLGAYYERMNPDDLYLRFFSRAPRNTLLKQRKENFVRELNDTTHYTVFVVTDAGGALLGVCHAAELPLGENRESGVFEIAFSSSVHNMGIGTALVNTVLAWAEHDPHVQKLKAVTMNENMGMRTLFERSGFLGTRDPDDISLIEYEKNIEHQEK